MKEIFLLIIFIELFSAEFTLRFDQLGLYRLSR